MSLFPAEIYMIIIDFIWWRSNVFFVLSTSNIAWWLYMNHLYLLCTCYRRCVLWFNSVQLEFKIQEIYPNIWMSCVLKISSSDIYSAAATCSQRVRFIIIILLIWVYQRYLAASSRISFFNFLFNPISLSSESS